MLIAFKILIQTELKWSELANVITLFTPKVKLT